MRTRDRVHPLRLALVLGASALGGCRGDEGSSRAPVAPAVTASSLAAPSPTAGFVLPEPQRTRAGTLRFTEPALGSEPAATDALLARLEAEPSAEVRAAIVEALPRTRGAWLERLWLRYALEPEARVRTMMAAILPRAPRAGALRALADAVRDRDAGVRAEAALALAALPATPDASSLPDDLVAALVALLGDADGRVRAAAARSLGILRLAAHFEAVESLLADPDAETRLQAVHALARMDEARARASAPLRARTTDADARVARAAERATAAAPR